MKCSSASFLRCTSSYKFAPAACWTTLPPPHFFFPSRFPPIAMHLLTTLASPCCADMIPPPPAPLQIACPFFMRNEAIPLAALLSVWLPHQPCDGFWEYAASLQTPAFGLHSEGELACSSSSEQRRDLRSSVPSQAEPRGLRQQPQEVLAWRHQISGRS